MTVKTTLSYFIAISSVFSFGKKNKVLTADSLIYALGIN